MLISLLIFSTKLLILFVSSCRTGQQADRANDEPCLLLISSILSSLNRISPSYQPNQTRSSEIHPKLQPKCSSTNPKSPLPPNPQRCRPPPPPPPPPLATLVPSYLGQRAKNHALVSSSSTAAEAARPPESTPAAAAGRRRPVLAAPEEAKNAAVLWRGGVHGGDGQGWDRVLVGGVGRPGGERRDPGRRRRGRAKAAGDQVGARRGETEPDG